MNGVHCVWCVCVCVCPCGVCGVGGGWVRETSNLTLLRSYLNTVLCIDTINFMLRWERDESVR